VFLCFFFSCSSSLSARVTGVPVRTSPQEHLTLSSLVPFSLDVNFSTPLNVSTTGAIIYSLPNIGEIYNKQTRYCVKGVKFCPKSAASSAQIHSRLRYLDRGVLPNPQVILPLLE
jgi:hypothetical protein